MISVDISGRQACRRRCRCCRFTLAEIMVATSVMTIILGGMITFTVMTNWRFRAGVSQVWFTAEARKGSSRLTTLIENAKLASVKADGNSFYLINPDDTVSLIYFQNDDGNLNTITDNAIWFDPNTNVAGDAYILIHYVTPWPNTPIFSGSNGAVVMCFHVGDAAANVSASDRFSGPGYQGVRVRWAATPRNVGQVWTSQGFD